MSDQCDWPSFKEVVKGEKQMWGEVVSGKNSVLDTVSEAGFAAGFAAIWGPIAALNKVHGCPTGTQPKTLDFSQPPVPGYGNHEHGGLGTYKK
jgi:hypothetical protein